MSVNKKRKDKLRLFSLRYWGVKLFSVNIPSLSGSKIAKSLSFPLCLLLARFQDCFTMIEPCFAQFSQKDITICFFLKQEKHCLYISKKVKLSFRNFRSNLKDWRFKPQELSKMNSKKIFSLLTRQILSKESIRYVSTNISKPKLKFGTFDKEKKVGFGEYFMLVRKCSF